MDARLSSEPSMAMTPSPSPPRNQSPIDLYPIPDVDDDYSEDYSAAAAVY